jgi:protocatechuate 3,4-dioxygenase beta subunit
MKRLALVFGILLLPLLAVPQRQPASSSALAGSYQINGTLVHSLTGEPLAGVTVVLSLAPNAEPERQRVFNTAPRYAAPRPPEIRPVVTTSDGEFGFTGLRAGKYSLAASKRGFSQQLYEQHEQFSTAIVVGPDKDSSNIIFRLEPDASIGGRIIDEHNEPVPNAQVMLFREGMQNGRRGIYRTQQTSSSDQGMYRFAHIRPGKFYVVVSATPWYAQYAAMRSFRNVEGDGPAEQVDNAGLDVAFPLTFYPGVTDSARAEAIDLRPGQRETVDFALMTVPSLHVRVNAPGSEPGQNVNPTLMQQIFDSQEMEQRGRNLSFIQGVTEITGITPGHYLLQLHNNGTNRQAATVATREIDITGSTEVNTSDMPPGVNVTGTLRFDGPAPSDPVRLVLRRSRGFMAPVQLQVNNRGEISSDQLVPPDNYDLALPVNGYQISQIAVGGAKLKGQSLQVGASDVKLNIVAAKTSARVEGIAQKDGKPFAGAMIVLVPQNMERPLLYRRDQSDSDGSFTLNAVTPGNYTLVALENGWDVEWSKPETMKPFLASGESLQVAVDGKYKLDVKVQ